MALDSFSSILNLIFFFYFFIIMRNIFKMIKRQRKLLSEPLKVAAEAKHLLYYKLIIQFSYNYY